MAQPTNEAETIQLYEVAQEQLGWHIAYLQRPFPDAIIENGNGQRLVAEFEYKAKNFHYHKHDPSACDLVICWHNDWPEAPLPIWALEDSLVLTEPYLSNVLASFRQKAGTPAVRYSFTLDAIKDADLVLWLEMQTNASSGIREALRAYASCPTHADIIAKLDSILSVLCDVQITSGQSPKENTPQSGEPVMARQGLDAMKTRFKQA